MRLIETLRKKICRNDNPLRTINTNQEVGYHDLEMGMVIATDQERIFIAGWRDEGVEMITNNQENALVTEEMWEEEFGKVVLVSEKF